MQFKCRITIIIILAGKNVAQHEAKKEEMIFPIRRRFVDTGTSRIHFQLEK